MCGIAGFSLNPQDECNTDELAKMLLWSIEERGQDAAGVAYPDRDKNSPVIRYIKKNVTASQFIEQFDLKTNPKTAILHTRLATQGAPTDNNNNHPIVVNHIVGVHNGMLFNDNEIFREMEVDRIGKVDSEAAFAALAYGTRTATRLNNSRTHLDVLEQIEGTAALAWLDNSQPEVLQLARVKSSPLIWGQTKNGSLVFASTEYALELAESILRSTLVHLEIAKEGTYFKVLNGRITDASSFKPLPSYSYPFPQRSFSPGPVKVHKAYSTTWQPKDHSSLPLLQGLEDSGWNREDDPYWSREEPVVEGEEYFFQYEDREIAIDEFLAKVNAPMSVFYDIATVTGAFLRPGHWVETQLYHQKVRAQVLRMPQTFPSGEYRLRVTIPGTNDMIGIGRTIEEITMIDDRMFEAAATDFEKAFPDDELETTQEAS